MRDASSRVVHSGPHPSRAPDHLLCPARDIVTVSFVVLSLVQLGVGRSVASEPIRIKTPDPKNFQLAEAIEALCAVTSTSPNDESGRLRAEIIGLHQRMYELHNKATALMARRLTDSDLGEVDRHNRAVLDVIAAMDAHSRDITPLAERFGRLLPPRQPLLRQNTAMMGAVAYFLTVTGRFNQDRRPNAQNQRQTHCSEFVDAYAKLAFGYKGFDRRVANDMVSHMRDRNSGWAPIQYPSGQRQLAVAQDLANKGYLVVVGLEVAGSEGHVAVVVPGRLEPSKQWGRSVPQIAQAGNERIVKELGGDANDVVSVFGREKLSYGIDARDMNKFEIFYRIR
jgi:hypothetical protein